MISGSVYAGRVKGFDFLKNTIVTDESGKPGKKIWNPEVFHLKKLFDIDGPVMRFLSRMGDLILINLLFLGEE